MERLYHPWNKWECYWAGFFNNRPPDGFTDLDCELTYAKLLTNNNAFRKAAMDVISNWPYSCDQFLTNSSINRIAWMGQASLCYAYGIPAKYRVGYRRLTRLQQVNADIIALDVINIWAFLNGLPFVSDKTIHPRLVEINGK